ncbi:MAG: hypothetical protein ACLU38_11925 [Dysosmobacter sp.]
MKYEGYIKRQLQQVAEFKRVEGRSCPRTWITNAIQGLRLEQEKLSAVQSRIWEQDVPDLRRQPCRFDGADDLAGK